MNYNVEITAKLDGCEFDPELLAEKIAREGGGDEDYFNGSKNLFEAILEYVAFSEDLDDADRTTEQVDKIVQNTTLDQLNSMFDCDAFDIDATPGSVAYSRFCDLPSNFQGNIQVHNILVWQQAQGTLNAAINEVMHQRKIEKEGRLDPDVPRKNLTDEFDAIINERDFLALKKLFKQVDYLDLGFPPEMYTLCYVLDRKGKAVPGKYRYIVKNLKNLAEANDAAEIAKVVAACAMDEMQKDKKIMDMMSKQVLLKFAATQKKMMMSNAYYFGFIGDLKFLPYWFKVMVNEYSKDIEFDRMMAISRAIEKETDFSFQQANDIYLGARKYRDIANDMYYYAVHQKMNELNPCNNNGITAKMIVAKTDNTPMYAYIALASQREKQSA